MSVVSLNSIEHTVKNRLLTYTPLSGTTLAVLIGSTTSGSGRDGKLYLDQPPDNVSGFYGVMRLLDAPQQGLDGGFMVRGLFELILYGRPREVAPQVKRMADVVTEAWNNYRYTESTGRCLVARDITNRMVIPYEAPADRELVAVRMLLPFMATPSFLTG